MASTKRLRATFVLVLAVGSMIAAGNAHAAQGGTSTDVKFTDNESLLAPLVIPVISPDDPDTFTGTIASPVAACKNARKVKVYRKGSSGSDDVALGKAVASATDGKWTFSSEDPGVGKYYAIVRGTAGCKAFKSKNIKVTADA